MDAGHADARHQDAEDQDTGYGYGGAGDGDTGDSAGPQRVRGQHDPDSGAPVEGAGGAEAARSQRGPVFWVKIGFGVLVVVFGALFVARHWGSVSGALAEMGWMAVLGSVPLGAAGVVAGMLAWRALLADLGAPLRLRDAGHVFFLSQLGKYVPGSVWPIVAQVELSRQLRVRREASLAATVLCIVLSVTCGLSVAAALLPLGGTGTLRHYWWVALTVPVLVALLHPALIVGLLGRLLRAVGRAPLQARPTLRGIARAAGWQVLGWLLLGLHAYVLLLGLHVDPVRTLPLAVGGFALAYCLGVLVIPAPAGAGVRDAALAVALSTAVASPQALAVALVSRLVMAAVDFGLAGAWSIGRPVGRPAGTAGRMPVHSTAEEMHP